MLWRKEFKEFKPNHPFFGVAASPIVDRGLLIVHVGGNDNGALKAFDAATGEEKWSWNDDGPAYATPIVVDTRVGSIERFESKKDLTVLLVLVKQNRRRPT